MISKIKYYLTQKQYTLDELIQFLLSFALIVVPIFFIPDRNLSDPYSQPRLIMLGTIASALLLIFLFDPSRIIVIFKRNLLINSLVLIYILILTYSLTYSIDLEFSLFGFHVWKDGYIVQLIYFVFFFAAQSGFKFNNSLFKGMLISGTLIAIYGIFQSFGIDFMIESNYSTLPVTAGMYNQNFLGSYLVLILPISIFMFLKEMKSYYLISYFLMLYAFLGTMTRGAWIGFMFSVIALIIILCRRILVVEKLNKKISILTLTSFVVIILFSLFNDSVLLDRFLSIFNDANNLLASKKVEQLGSYRGLIWRETINYIFKKPIQGYGIQNIMLYFLSDHVDKFTFSDGKLMLINNVHNEYLQIAVSTGIPSLIIIAVANIKILLKGFKRILTNEFFAPIMLAIFGYLVQYFFSLSFITNTFILYIMLGYTLINTNNDNIY